MDIKQLRSMGLMAPNPLVKQTITIKYRPLKPDGEREDEEVEAALDFWIRKFTAADQIAIHGAPEEERVYVAIQRSVFNEDGTALFPDVDSARELDLTMFGEMMVAINEFNEAGSKKSQPRTSGGARSRLPSADEASANGKSPSPKKKSRSGSSTSSDTAP
jgi:hypothetical protein